MNARTPVLQIKTSLRRTWQGFFGRFGRLLPIQIAAIPPILARRNVIISAPTAAGKTEAVVAPLAERLLADGAPSVGILYIAPTRALVNDVERRLAGPCATADLSVAVRTGDRRELRLKSQPHVLITTPESTDSMLCRIPQVFRDTRAIVLDEVHQLDGNYRGDQMRVLLRRLERISGRQQHIIALSATLPDAQEVAARYMTDPEVCQAGLPRGIELQLTGTVEEAVALLRQRKRHKALLFCNRRKDVEELAQQLVTERQWPAEALFVHHGSLPRELREKTETAMRLRSWGLCIATMTLELGIDIGDVNAVILYGLPPTPSAFQQRIGRACRTERTIFVIGVPRNENEAALFRIFEGMAVVGRVEDQLYRPDVSVIVQQVCSLLFANPGGCQRQDLANIVQPLTCEAPFDALNAILDQMEEDGWIERPYGWIKATTKLMNLGERGKIHSNIPDAGEFHVVDSTSGQIITHAHLQVAPGSRIALAGRTWEVVRITGQKAFVKPAAGVAEARFLQRAPHGAFWGYLPPDLMQWVEENA